MFNELANVKPTHPRKHKPHSTSKMTSESDLTAEKIAQQFGLSSEHGQYAWRVMLNSPLDAERCQAIVSSPRFPGLCRADVCAVCVRYLVLRGRTLFHIGGDLLLRRRKRESRSRRWTQRGVSYASLRLLSSYVLPPPSLFPPSPSSHIILTPTTKSYNRQTSHKHTASRSSTPASRT